MTYRVAASVRKVGAIGVFYPMTFDVEADGIPARTWDLLTPESEPDYLKAHGDIADAFLAQHGHAYELNHVDHWTPKA